MPFKLFMTRVLEFIEQTFQIHTYNWLLRRRKKHFSILGWNETQHFAANYTRQLLTDSAVQALSYIKLDFFFAPTASVVAFCLFTARFMTLTATNPNSNRTVPPSKFNLPHFSDSTLCHEFPSFSSQIRVRRQFCMLIATLKLRLVEISEKSSDKSRLVLTMSRENVSIYLRSTLDGPYMKGIPCVNLISLAF